MTLVEALTGGAFDLLNWQHSGEFDQNFSKKVKWPGVCPRGMGGFGIDRYIKTVFSCPIRCETKTMAWGAFHSTKISGNSGSKLNGTEKFRSTSRGCPFSLEIWKFPVPLGISTRYESAPVPLAVKSFKMAASLSSRHYTGCKINCHNSEPILHVRI